MRIWLGSTTHSEGADDPFTSLLPIGLLTMNAVLRQAGFDSTVVNFTGMGRSGLSRLLASSPPDLVGLSQFTHNRNDTVELARFFREMLPDCTIVLGGPHATFCWREILDTHPCIDAVAVGEGEMTMLELARNLEAGQRISGIPGLAVRDEEGRPVLCTPRDLIADLDELPIAGQYLDKRIGFESRQQLEFIISSRGCPSACLFCSSPAFWGRKLRFRSPESMIAEIRLLRERFGLIYFSIRDDTFTADRRRVIDFCRQLLQERLFILWNCQSRVNALDAEMLTWMKRAGCECIQLGVESGSVRVLQSLGKRITPDESLAAARLVHDAGIRLSIYLIAGTKAETDDDIKSTCHLVDGMSPGDGQVSPLVYYPGTALFEQGVAAGDISAGLFAERAAPALQVRGDVKVASATRAISRALERSAARATFTAVDFAGQKLRLGYCHATCLMAGETFAGRGDMTAAEREYREIVNREPDNPWGWLALGELYAECGRLDEAIDAYTTLCTVVPAHEPGYRMLAELFRLKGDKGKARENLRHAEELLRQ